MERACALLEQKKVTTAMEERQVIDRLWDTYGLTPTTAAQERAELEKTRRPAWRAAVPERAITFCDLLQGEYREELKQDCGDFILRRSDGVYAYQLAVVVDDAMMGVTQVVRGSDLLSSTPRQIWLQERLNLPHPQYGHVPLLLAPDGRRLAKRDRDQELGQLQSRFTAPQIVGTLAHAAGLLDREEEVAPEELLPLFRWDKLPRKDLTLSIGEKI